MSKVRNYAEIAPNSGFSEFDFYDLYRSTFEKSELGRMKEHPLSSEACRKRAAEHFDKDKCFEKYINLYNTLLVD